MPLALFNKIHDSCLYFDRTTPATIEEFVEFGLQPEDYLRYVSLQMRVQSECMMGNLCKNPVVPTENHQEALKKAIEELLRFCLENHLIENNYQRKTNALELIDKDDVAYLHGWLCYPKESSDFRLSIERKLSSNWDLKEEYITNHFGNISFTYDSCCEDTGKIDSDSDARIRRYDPVTQASPILNHSEVMKIYELAKREKEQIHQEVDSHLAQVPSKKDVAAVTAGRSWIKRMYELFDRQTIIDEFYDDVREASHAADIYQFKDSDTLYVFLGPDMCQQQYHLVSSRRVEFSFYDKPNKQYNIMRCSHCSRYQVTLSELNEIFETYGVPHCQIKYIKQGAHGEAKFLDFAETSTFYDMGYTVSQSAGLSTEQRQSILKNAIDSGKASKYEVLSFLRQRMDINGMKGGNELASRKWKEDYEYIRQL